MKKIFYFVFCVLFGALLSMNCSALSLRENVNGNGKVVEVKRDLNSFSKIRNLGPIDVFIKGGQEQSVQIVTDENLVQYFELKVNENGVLELHIDRSVNIKTCTKLQVHITMPDFADLFLAGSGSINVDGEFSIGDDVKMAIAGSGDIKVGGNMNFNKLNLSIAGSGDIKFENNSKAHTIDASIAGSGDINAGKIISKNTRISIAGSGNFKTYTEISLKVNIAGSGDVYYGGQPELKVSKVGSGSVIPKSNLEKL